MFFANLGLAEFLTLFAAAASITVALYLLSRARRKQIVSTLRFWANAVESVKQVHRRRVDQPWSLALQLIGLLFLLLALAQPRIGKRDTGARDHVLLLDATAWTTAVTPEGTLLRDVKIQALRWLRALPSQDRVMVVRLDTIPTPLTRFEADRKKVEEAVRRTASGSGSLGLEDSLSFATNALRMNAQRAGEIVYAGSGRMAGSVNVTLPQNLRVLAVKRQPDNAGILKVDLRRSPTEPEVWQAFLTVRNYAGRMRRVPFVAALGGAPVFTGSVDLAANAENTSSFSFRGPAAGWFEIRLNPRDDLALDDRVTLELPAERILKVAVFTAEPALLRPILTADARIQPTFFSPSEYQAEPAADLIILDRMRPPAPPKRNAVWIEPPATGSPVQGRPIGATTIEKWLTSHPLGQGLRSKDLKLDSAMVFSPSPGDLAVASAPSGALILARPGQFKTVVMGFQPLRTALRFELATPLLFANIFHWMSPDLLRRQEVQAAGAGAVTVALDPTADLSKVRVTSDGRADIPYTLDGRDLRFFTASPTTVRVITDVSEQVFALNLPRVGETLWEPPAGVRKDLTSLGASTPLPKETWRLLAILGLAAFLLEWFLFGRERRRGAAGRMLQWPAFLRRAS